MTVRVIALALCSTTQLLSVSQLRSCDSIELLQEGPQWPLRFAQKWNGINQTSALVAVVTPFYLGLANFGNRWYVSL